MRRAADRYCPTVTSFIHWISEHMVYGLRQTRKERFLPSGKLDQYFMQAGRLGALVEEATRPGSADLHTIHKGFIKIFTILLWIGEGPYIEHFISYPDVLSDNQLPFVDRPKHFPWRPDSDFFEAFNNAQWQFCSPLFQYERLQDTKYSDRVILPISSFERIGDGGSAIVSKFELHPDHDSLKVGRKAPSSVSTEPPRQYVLKTFRSRDAEINYNNERAAFSLLRGSKPHPHIVCYYGSFRHSDTFNIILEYADRGDLEQYLQNTNPPSNAADIVNLWEGMSGLLLALLKIHGLQLDSAKGPRTMTGFHQDLKLSNIFLISGKTGSPYEVQLKIGDFGTAHFTQATSEGEVIAISAHGTHMYAPPESHISDPAQNHTNLPITPSVDIWSLGCLYHEVLVWMVFGHKQLLAYRRGRMLEAASFGIDDGECFHKRYDVLRAVKSMNERLRSEAKHRGGYNTDEILNIIEDMIVIDPSKRKSPKSLYDKLKTILFESRTALQKSQASGAHGSATYRRLTDYSGTPTGTGVTRLNPRNSVPARYNHAPPYEPRNGEFTQPYPLPPERDENRFFNCPVAPATSNKRTHRASANTPTTLNEEQTKKRPAHWVATPGFGAPLNHMAPPCSPDQRICHPPTSATTASAGQALPHDRRWRLQPTKSEEKTVVNVTQQGELLSPLESPRQLQPPNVFAPYQTNPVSYESVQNPHQHYPSPRSTPDDFRASKDTGQDLTSQDLKSSHNVEDRFDLKHFEDDSKGRGIRRNGSEHGPSWRETSASPPIPKCTIHEAGAWISNQKSTRNSRLPNGIVLNDLRKRDYVFILDNSRSMHEHWPRVTELLYILTYLVKHTDKNGIDLYFTSAAIHFNSSRSTQLKRAAEKQACAGTSDIKVPLRKVLDRYRSQLEKHPKTSKFRMGLPVRPLTIIVFTDGMWREGSDPENSIIDAVDALESTNWAGQQQLGIQFIQFGDDSAATRKLEELDTLTKKHKFLKRDIVDTTKYADDNVLKMILGGTHKRFDADE